jgi:hypothetical protein
MFMCYNAHPCVLSLVFRYIRGVYTLYVAGACRSLVARCSRCSVPVGSQLRVQHPRSTEDYDTVASAFRMLVLALLVVLAPVPAAVSMNLAVYGARLIIEAP